MERRRRDAEAAASEPSRRYGPPSRCAEPFEPRRDCRVHARRRRIDSATTPRERSRRQTSRDGARVGASRTRGGTFAYAPIVIRTTRSSRRSHSTHPRSVARAHRTSDATYTDGVGRARHSRDEKRNRPRHATRVLEALGHGDPSGRVAMIDRHRACGGSTSRAQLSEVHLATYDVLYAQAARSRRARRVDGSEG